MWHGMYDIGFREAAIRLYQHLGSLRKVATALKVSPASICRWTKRIQPLTTPLQTRIRSFVAYILHQNPLLTCKDIVVRIHEALRLKVSRQLVGCVLRSTGFTRKCIRRRVGSSSPSKQQTFCEEYEQQRGEGRLIVSVDESGFDQRPSVVYGYTPKGTV